MSRCTCVAILKGDGIDIKGFDSVSKFRQVAAEPWVEVKCNRPDDHPISSEHWHEDGEVTVRWNVPEDAVWIA